MPYNNHLIKPVSLTHKRTGKYVLISSIFEKYEMNNKCILMVGPNKKRRANN